MKFHQQIWSRSRVFLCSRPILFFLSWSRETYRTFLWWHPQIWSFRACSRSWHPRYREGVLWLLSTMVQFFLFLPFWALSYQWQDKTSQQWRLKPIWTRAQNYFTQWWSLLLRWQEEAQTLHHNFIAGSSKLPFRYRCLLGWCATEFRWGHSWQVGGLFLKEIWHWSLWEGWEQQECFLRWVVLMWRSWLFVQWVQVFNQKCFFRCPLFINLWKEISLIWLF